MRIKLVKAQRYACIATAWVIVLFQLLTFAQDGGIVGHDWAYSIIIAAGFGMLGTRRITEASGSESAAIESGAAKPVPAPTASTEIRTTGPRIRIPRLKMRSTRSGWAGMAGFCLGKLR